MAFKDFATEAKKLAPKYRIGEVLASQVPNASTKNIIDETNYHEFKGSGFGMNGKKQALDERHCNIIKNVVKEAQSDSPAAPATWQSCRFHKTKGERDFCTEYVAWCSKENCSRARK